MTTSQSGESNRDMMCSLVDMIIQSFGHSAPWFRDAILYCAVPHWFDETVIHGMRLPGEAADVSDEVILQKLKQFAFCQKHPIHGSTYHEDVRDYILSRPEIQTRRQELHARAAATFHQMLEQTGVGGEDRFREAAWQDLAVEWLYHWLNVEPQAALTHVQLVCAEAIAAWQEEFCAEFLNRLESSIEAEEVEQKITFLKAGVKVLLEYDYVKALPILYSLVALPDLTHKQESTLRWRIGTTHFYAEGRRAAAREQLEKALALTPEGASVHAELAVVYLGPDLTSGRLDLALHYANQAVKLAKEQADGYIALGAIAAQQEEYDQAIAWYKKAIQEDPTVDGYLCLSVAYAARRDVIKGIENIDKAVEISPATRCFAFIRKGDVYRNARRFQEARQAYEQAISEAPQRRDAYIGLGDLYMALSQSAKAAEQYHKAIDVDPAVDDGYAALAHLHYQRAAWDETIAVCQQGLDKGVAGKALYIILSNVFTAQGRLEDVKRIQQQIVQIDQEEAYAAACAVGDAYLTKAGQHKHHPDQQPLMTNARMTLEEAVACDPNRGWAYLSLGELAVLENNQEAIPALERLVGERTPWSRYGLLVKLGAAYQQNFQSEESEKHLISATELAPHRTAAWQALSDLYTWRGDVTGVARVWKALLRIDSALAYNAHIAIGNAYEYIADYSRARAEFTGAQSLEPETADAYLRLARLDEMEGNGERAITNYQCAAVRASDWAASAYTRIASMHRSNGNDDEAEQAARTAIIHDAKQPAAYIELACIGATVQRKRKLIDEAQTRLGQVLPEKLYDLDYALGELYRALGDDQSAHKAYQRCIERDATRADAYIGKGLVLIHQAQHESARACLNQALQINPWNVETHLALSEVLYQQRNVPGVQETWQRIIVLEPTKRYDALVALGRVHLQCGDFASAEQSLKSATELASWRPEAYLELGSLLLRQNRLNEADDVYREAQEKWTGVGYLELGRYYEQQGKREEAQEAYRLSTQYEPPERAALACVAYGYMLEVQEKYGEAAEKYQQAITLQAITLAPRKVDGYLALASLHRQQNQTDKTEQFLHKAAEIAPDDPAVYELWARLREEQKQWQAAIELYEKVATLQPRPGVASAAYERMGDLLIQRQSYHEAEEALQKALQRDSSNAGACFSLGTIYEQQGDLDQAIALYKQAIELIPKYGNAYVALGRVFYKKGDKQSLSQMTQTMLALDLEPSEQYTAHLLAAAVYDESKDYQEAEKAYRQAMQLDPTRADAYQGLVNILVNQGQLDNAVQICHQMAQQPDLAYAAHILLGNLFDSHQRFAQAEAAYRRAIAVKPNLLDAYIPLLQLLVQQDLTDAAFQVCREMAQQPQLAYDACGVLGGLFLAQEKFNEAEAVYRQAIAAHPELPGAYPALMDLMVAQDRIDDAFQVSSQMAQQPGLAHRAYVELGNLLASQAKDTEAERAYRRAIELDPHQAGGYVQLAWLYNRQQNWTAMEQIALQANQMIPNHPAICLVLARLREEQQQLDEAIVLYRKVAELEPEPMAASDAFANAGRLLIAQARDDEAEDLLRNAIHCNAENAQAYFDLGRLYEQQDRVEQARDMYTTATRIAPKFGDAYFGRARVYKTLQDIPSLSQMAQEILALELSPEEKYSAHLLIAATYKEAALYEWAIEELNKAVALDPKRVEAYSGLGDIYRLQQRWERAHDTYKKIIEVSPESAPDVHMILGALFIQQNNPAAAKDEYHKAIELAPERPDGYFILGQFLTDLEQWEEAIHVYNNVATLGLDAATTAYLRIGDIYRRLGKTREMREVWSSVVSLVDSAESPDGNLLRRQGLAYFRCGEYPEAARALNRALAANSQDIQARFYLALNLLCQGEGTQAQMELERGITLAQHKGDYYNAIAEAKVLAARAPEANGAQEMLQRLIEARDAEDQE